MQGLSQISLTNTCGNCSRCPAWSAEKIYVLCLKLENLLKFKLFCINFKLKSIDFWKCLFLSQHKSHLVVHSRCSETPASIFINQYYFSFYSINSLSFLYFYLPNVKTASIFFFFCGFFLLLLLLGFFNTNRCTYT